MALNVYQTPVMVLGGITQDPNHLNIFQMPVMVLGTTEAPPANTQVVGSYGEYSVSVQSANTIASRLLVGDVSVNVMSAQNANLITARSLVRDQSQYLFSGQNAGLVVSVPTIGSGPANSVTIKISHPYAVQPIIAANETRNGSMITFVSQAGNFYKKTLPDVNRYVDSGVMNVRVSGRFDESYGNAAIP
jgi:hypothetical protein